MAFGKTGKMSRYFDAFCADNKRLAPAPHTTSLVWPRTPSMINHCHERTNSFRFWPGQYAQILSTLNYDCNIFRSSFWQHFQSISTANKYWESYRCNFPLPLINGNFYVQEGIFVHGNAMLAALTIIGRHANRKSGNVSAPKNN